ncbi:hypothetical protein F3087_44895 [Nocardia colli]|uniref:Uncharacterized protein n=1 Tax=Nocardia colli TaxID=2545717 RepID=A0A5N0DMQ0_9NOCA|nr:hypothetical protein [Nocardia colli]KAA8877314.1 hypothetical protein F3087_44895 [Nocardia colli]
MRYVIDHLLKDSPPGCEYMGMTLQWATEGWQSISRHGLWPALALVSVVIGYELIGCVRSLQQHWTTRMVVRQAPPHTTVRSTVRRRGGVVSELIVEVGYQATGSSSNTDDRGS